MTWHSTSFFQQLRLPAAVIHRQRAKHNQSPQLTALSKVVCPHTHCGPVTTWIKPKQERGREIERDREEERNWRGQSWVTRHLNARATMTRAVIICTNKPRSTQLLHALRAAAATIARQVRELQNQCLAASLFKQQTLRISQVHCASSSFVHRGLWGQHAYLKHHTAPLSDQALCTRLAAIAMTVPQQAACWWLQLYSRVRGPRLVYAPCKSLRWSRTTVAPFTSLLSNRVVI